MKKKQFVETYKAFVKDIGEEPRYVLVSAGGALLMMGIREETSDLDLDVSDGVFKSFAKRIGTSKGCGGVEIVNVNETISLHATDPNTGVVCIDGVWCYSPGEVLMQKRILKNAPGRSPLKKEQDAKDILAIEALISSKKVFTAKVI